MSETKRRICWPNPDPVCLEGGCIYCNDYPYVRIDTIRRYAANKVAIRYEKAFRYGEINNWPNIDKK